MTIIAFDGVNLVADSRMTTGTQGQYMDNICKIHPMTDFNIPYSSRSNSKLIAIAYAGLVSSIELFHTSLIGHLAPGGVHSGTVKTFAEWIKLKSTFGDILPRASALALFKDEDGKITVKKLRFNSLPNTQRKHPMVIGSGLNALGDILVDVPKLTAVDLVSLAITKDKGCGGRMTVFNAVTGKLTMKESITPHRKKLVAKYISEHILTTL